MIWRIYRLPGSKTFWHIDTGKDTAVFNVTDFDCRVNSHSIDIGEGFPRAWIELDRSETELHIVDGVAIFTFVPMIEIRGLNPLKDDNKCAAAVADVTGAL